MTRIGRGCIIESMGNVNLSLEHVVRQAEVDSEGGPPPLLILVHGLRSNEYDLYSLIPYLDERFVIVSVRAPIELAPLQYAWYRVEFTVNGLQHDSLEFERSLQQLKEFTRQATQAYSADPSRVYMMGFSQGAMMSLALLFTEPEMLAGVVVMSGALPFEELDYAIVSEHVSQVQVIVVHGVNDNVLPIAEGRAIREHLMRVNAKLDYREYPMGHQISDESLDDVCGWLIKQLDATSATTLNAES